MARRFTDRVLVIASHNLGKIREIADLLGPYDVLVRSAGEMNVAEPEETGATFVENALIKARASAEGARLPALADDSGLAVEALGGAPGIHSARWAGAERDFSMAMRRVHDEMREAEDRRAGFVCALALAWPDGHAETFEGRVDGRIVWPPRGDRGFGYDPIFVPEGHEETFAEMPPERKHAISHRADAFARLVAACFE